MWNKILLNMLNERRDYYRKYKYVSTGHELVLPEEFDEVMDHLKELEKSNDYLMSEYTNLLEESLVLKNQNKELKKTLGLADKALGDIQEKYDDYIKAVLNNETKIF